MEADKNIFGQYELYQSPVHTEEEKVIIEAVLNGVALQFRAMLSDDEFIKYTHNLKTVMTQVVPAVNDALPEGIAKVDGKSIRRSVKAIIKEHVDTIIAEQDALRAKAEVGE